MNVRHELKILPPHFEAVVTYQKRFEVRKDDRGFKIHDELLLNEFDLSHGYTGRFVVTRITYILRGAEYGIHPDYVVLGIADYWEDDHGPH